MMKIIPLLSVLLGCSARDEPTVSTNQAVQETPTMKKATAARKHKWPNTDPIDKSDPYWKFNNNLNANGIQYKKEEVSPGRWQWVVDKEAMEFSAKREKHRRELFWALRSRVLTDEEMEEVNEYGERLNIESGVPYLPADKDRELNEALLQQFRLRQAAKK